MARRIRTTTVQALMTRALPTGGHAFGAYAARRTGSYLFDLVMPGAPRVIMTPQTGEVRVNFQSQSIRQYLERTAS